MMVQIQNDQSRAERKALSPLKVAAYGGIVVVAMAFVGVLALLVFPDPFVNSFIKPRITKAFAEAYPAYSIRIAGMSYDVLKNRCQVDSVGLNAVDGTFSGTVGPFSIRGIGWMHLLWGGTLAPGAFANAVVDAQDIVLTFPESQYEARCGQWHLSVPDSEMRAETLHVHALGDDDEPFFAGSRFRNTRFRLDVPHARVNGLACLELLQGNICSARSAEIHNVFLDILINKDKPSAKDPVGPPMPNEMLSSIKGALRIDTLSIINGRLNYGERFAVGTKPALISFDNMQVLVVGIANHGGADAAVVIHSTGTFMKAGTMNVVMSIPVASPEFALKFSGSMGRMELSALNAFLETAEQMRIKAGVLQAATFNINVASGRATGSVRAVYRDLTLAAINKHTGSEKGFVDGITSWVANTVTLRRMNAPDKSGAMKIGKVKYVRQREDPFFRIAWFALRSGLRDVVGF